MNLGIQPSRRPWATKVQKWLSPKSVRVRWAITSSPAGGRPPQRCRVMNRPTRTDTPTPHASVRRSRDTLRSLAQRLAGRLATLMSVFRKILRAGEGKKVRALESIVPDINAFEPELERLSDDELAHRTVEFRDRMANATAD